jgi:tetratricopeptide (TPR) repeat protein
MMRLRIRDDAADGGREGGPMQDKRGDRMKSRFVNVARVAKLLALTMLASCSQLECDSGKRAAMEHNNLGVQKMTAGSQAEAIKEFELALSMDKDNVEAAWNLGQVYSKEAEGKCRSAPTDPECANLWDKAAGAFEAAAKGNPKDPMFHFRMGEALFKAGKLDPARAALEQSLKLEKRLFRAHTYLGQIHEAQGRPRDAALEWTEAARLNPGFGKPFLYLGQLYYRWDFYPESVKVLEQGAVSARAADERADINYQLGLSYDALQQYDKAIAAYEASMKDDPGNQDTKLQLGFSYANKGDKKNAQKYLEDYTKSVGSSDPQGAFKVMAANSRLLKLLSE